MGQHSCLRPSPCTDACDDLHLVELFKVLKTQTLAVLNPPFHHSPHLPLLLEWKLAATGEYGSKAVLSDFLKTIINYN